MFWTSLDKTGSFGNYAGLFNANQVLQEDPCDSESDCLWGFFSGSTDTYTCGGFPQQLSVPVGSGVAGYIANEIWSPMIDVTGSGDEFKLLVRTYRDLPFENLVFFSWKIRSFVSGEAGPWRTRYDYYYAGTKDWLTVEEWVGALIEPGAESVQLALGVHDLSATWTPLVGGATCHTHGPLFDAVQLLRFDTQGPSWLVRHVDLLQDNFASDGTVTGVVRADAALDISSRDAIGIQPGDSLCVTVSAYSAGLDYEISGAPTSGPAVYCHVKNIGNKRGALLSDDETRWPLVNDDGDWTVLRFDSTGDNNVADRFCVDLNDNLFTPGDTVWYFFSARDKANRTTYWSRRQSGQGTGFATNSLAEVKDSPLEFTCLPANGRASGANILFVDGADDRFDVAQQYYETAFAQLGLEAQIDRYDILGPTSRAGNGLASRVSSLDDQVLPFYRTVLWETGDRRGAVVGDGGGADKSFDVQLLFDFLDKSPYGPGLYLSGDDVAWRIGQPGVAFASLRSYIDYVVLWRSHRDAGEPVSPRVRQIPGSVFDGGGPDDLLVFGGCSILNRFNILQPRQNAVMEMNYSGDDQRGAVVSQSSSNGVGSNARVVLSGFSYHFLRDAGPPVAERVDHMRDILGWLEAATAGTVELRSFSGQRIDSDVELMWSVFSSFPLSGFRMYRRRLPDGAETLLTTTALLPPVATRFVDDSAAPGSVYSYTLAAIRPGDLETRFSSVTVGGASPSPVSSFALEQNFPNPFNPETTIRYKIDGRVHVSINIYDAAGRRVKTLVNATQDPVTGGLEVKWDATNDLGDPVTSGIYFYRIVAGNFEQTRKMVLVR